MSVKTARMADVLHELGRAIDSAILSEDDLILWIHQRYQDIKTNQEKET